MTEYVKITLLEEMVIGIDWAKKGDLSYWRVIDDDGRRVILQHRFSKVSLTHEEIAQGERHSEPNLSLPIGLHVKLERGYKHRLFGGYRKI